MVQQKKETRRKGRGSADSAKFKNKVAKKKQQVAAKKQKRNEKQSAPLTPTQFAKTSIPQEEFVKDMEKFEDYMDEGFEVASSENLGSSGTGLLLGKNFGGKKWKKVDMQDFQNVEGMYMLEVLGGDEEDTTKLPGISYSSYSKKQIPVEEDEDHDFEADPEIFIPETKKQDDENEQSWIPVTDSDDEDKGEEEEKPAVKKSAKQQPQKEKTKPAKKAAKEEKKEETKQQPQKQKKAEKKKDEKKAKKAEKKEKVSNEEPKKEEQKPEEITSEQEVKSDTKTEESTEENKEEAEKEALTKLSVDMRAWKKFTKIIHKKVLQNLREMQFSNPTPVQAETLKRLMKNPTANIVSAAETGSGKTLAFGIPVVSALLKTSAKEEKTSRKMKTLVLTPTRELAIQITKHIKSIIQNTDLTIACVVGGISEQKQRRLLSYRPDIVVATPGRFWDFMEQGETHLTELDQLKYLVIDEADRMIAEGHFPELHNIINLIQKLRLKHFTSLPEKQDFVPLQKFVASATLTLAAQFREGARKEVNPGDERILDKLVKILDIDVKSAPKKVQKGKKKAAEAEEQEQEVDEELEEGEDGKLGKTFKDYQIVDLTPKNRMAKTVQETMLQCLSDEKDLYLYYFFQQYEDRTIVFTNSITAARHIHGLMALLGIHVNVLHGEMQQRQRLKNLERFQSNPKGILIATDVAARGLDIPNITNVIHYQLPRSAEIYVHRCGRSGRAQKEGFSVAFVAPDDRKNYHKICEATEKEEIPQFPVDLGLLGALRERVTVAKQINSAQKSFTKHKSKASWFVQQAKAADIDLDDTFFPGIKETAKQDNIEDPKVAKLQAKLAELLNQKVRPTQVLSKRYIRDHQEVDQLKASKRKASENFKEATTKQPAKKKQRKQ